MPAGPARKIYPIVKYGDPVLEKPTAPISEFNEELEELTEDMFASMYAAQGVGLAAPQIGKSMRIDGGGCDEREKSGSEDCAGESGNYSRAKARSARKKDACRFPDFADTWCGRNL